MKRFNTSKGIVDTGLITSTVITGGISIVAFASDVGLPVGIALSETSLLLSLATAITQKSFKIFTVKHEKHDLIKLRAQSKLDSIANFISQEMQDGYIFPTEFHKVLQEVKKQRKLKADIRNHARAKIKEITNKQREKILEQGKQEGKEDFFKKIPNSSGTQGANTTLWNVILWSIKTVKNRFKIYLSSMWNQLQDPTPHQFFIDNRVTIYHDIFLKSLLCEVPHRIFHQLLIMHMLINGLLLWNFIQTRHTAGGIPTKNNLLVHCDSVFEASSSSSLVFIQFPRGIFNFFASSNSDFLFIYY